MTIRTKPTSRRKALAILKPDIGKQARAIFYESTRRGKNCSGRNIRVVK